ncbi:MAG: XRE family transcriptional regulator [Planctomycetes bacterium]|nr:XRE family transcriptional regulator [Planctomycetota bacterium]
MTAITNETAHVTTNKLFEDLGFSPEEAAVLELKLKLHIEIMKEIKRQKITPRKLERVLDVPQPRVSELIGGKISKMSIDKLTKYLHRLGREVKVTTKKIRKLEAV